MRNNRRTNTENRRTTGSQYVTGTAVRKVNRTADNATDRRFRTIQGGAKAHRTSKITNVAHLMLMLGALALATFVLYNYVSVQTSLESSVTQISRLEKQLAQMKQENDEAYSRANSTVDLEEVKRIAIQELGMKYADEGQIIIYSDEGAHDYVRQMADIPEAGKK